MTTVVYKISYKELLWINVRAVVQGLLLKFLGIVFLVNLLTQLVKIYHETNIGLSGLVIAILASIFAAGWETLWIWIPGTLIALIILIAIVWFRLRTRNPIIDSPIKFSFSETGLISETNLTKTEFKWDYLKRVRSLKNYYLLQTKQPTTNFSILPKRAFSYEQKMEFEKLLKDKKILITK